MISAQHIRELLRYDQETGLFTWLSGQRKGMTAGNMVKGYRQIMIGKKNYAAHRLAWLYVTGEWPTDDLDHSNLDGTDNRFLNLRLASPSQNLANIRPHKDNRCGLKGVNWRRGRRWIAQITVNYKNTYLGTFDCPAAAHFRYSIEADRRFGEFARAA